MTTINGLTKELTIDGLNSYLEHNSQNYICKYLEAYYAQSYRDEIFEFISYWVKKLYGDIKHNPESGYFGNWRREQNAFSRIKFVESIIKELNNN